MSLRDWYEQQSPRDQRVLLAGAGAPRELLGGVSAHLMLPTTADGTFTGILILSTRTEAAMLVVPFKPDLHG